MLSTKQLSAVADLEGRTVQSVTEIDGTLVIICDDTSYLILEIEDSYDGYRFQVQHESPRLFFLSEQHPLVTHGIVSVLELRAAKMLHAEQERARRDKIDRDQYERLKAKYGDA